jgi:hypothetical protein
MTIAHLAASDPDELWQGVRPTGVMPVCHGHPAALLDTEKVLLRSAA